MATGTITGYTATRMQAIEDGTVVGGSVVGDNLILTRHDAATINAGNVRGPQGPAAPIHTGAISMWLFSTTPVGHLPLEGQTVVNAQTLYPDLWALAPAGWKSGSSLIMPDMRGRMPIGQTSSNAALSTLVAIGGSANAVAVAHVHQLQDHVHSMPTHTHSVPDHNHTTPNHQHYLSNDNGGTGVPWRSVTPGVGSYDVLNAGSGVSLTWHTALQTDFGGGGVTSSVSGQATSANVAQNTASPSSFPSTASQTPSSDGVNANLPPFLVVRYMIKT
jgi:hypothetical protein